MYYASYNENTGHITGFRKIGESYPTPTPAPYIIITDAEHTEFFEKSQRHKIINGIFTYVDPPVPTLDEEKQKAWERIKTERDRRESAGFLYQGKLIDSDPTSAQRIGLAAQAALVAKTAGQTFSLDWTTANNTTLTLDADGVIGMPLALAQHSNALHVTARELRQQINAATTVEEVNAIVWPE